MLMETIETLNHSDDQQRSDSCVRADKDVEH